MELTIILLAGGAILGALAYHFFNKRKQQRIIRENSTILLKRVRQVLKLVTIEGDFSEIVTYNDIKPLLFKLYEAEKKAIVTVSAKAMVGFDLSKAKIDMNETSRTISILELPRPEIISIDSNIQFFDIRNNLLNKFKPEDYTRINQLAKESIKEGIPESGMYEQATGQAIELLQGLEILAERLDWKLDYQYLKSLPAGKSDDPQNY
ncbi:MAG: DUF4230 domain-containing protein [Bacteroidota bacterium]